jgi:hypothetical protein
MSTNDRCMAGFDNAALHESPEGVDSRGTRLSLLPVQRDSIFRSAVGRFFADEFPYDQGQYASGQVAQNRGSGADERLGVRSD